MWKVAWFYEKVHSIATFRGYTAIPLTNATLCKCVAMHHQVYATLQMKNSTRSASAISSLTIFMIVTKEP